MQDDSGSSLYRCSYMPGGALTEQCAMPDTLDADRAGNPSCAQVAAERAVTDYCGPAPPPSASASPLVHRACVLTVSTAVHGARVAADYQQHPPALSLGKQTPWGDFVDYFKENWP